MLFVRTYYIYKSTSYIYLFNNCKEKWTFFTRPRVLTDQISQEILVGIVTFLAFQSLPLKLHVIQTPFQKLGRNSLYKVLNISYFSHFTSNISGQQYMGLEAALTWKTCTKKLPCTDSFIYRKTIELLNLRKTVAIFGSFSIPNEQR